MLFGLESMADAPGGAGAANGTIPRTASSTSAMLAEQLALQPRRGRLATNERTEYEPRE